MKAAIKGGFAVIAVLLFFLAAVTVLLGAQRTAGFTPNSGQAFLLDAAGGGLIAFIAAQLGLAIAASGGGLRNKVKATMGWKWGDIILLIDVIVFLVVGMWFVLLWVKPDLIAVPGGSEALKDAPAYVESQAKQFVGVVLAALAALAPSAS